MTNSLKKPEILAPCGSFDIMKAAINAGADACYFGGFRFGARAYATNFDLDNSLKAIDYAHIHGTSLYLTVNTLFKNNEIDELYDYILPYYEAGLDAVIVQDFGVFKYIKEHFPGIHIHCSTQMNITSKYSTKAMKELGASRIVTAREMSLEEIQGIKESVDIEVESFVHGAMCYSYSGRCLMSSLAGGRSGNRGRCAQPCRKCYDGEYILSMKDMCTLTEVPKLIDAGIDSLKIEGRMKNEYYVASAVDAYNQIADDCVSGCYSEQKALDLKFKLANIYNRGGFCESYYFIHNGPYMISKDRPNNQGVELGKITYAKDGEINLSLYQDLFKQDVIEIKLNDSSVIEITSGVEAKKNTDVRLKCPKTKMVRIGQIALRTRCNHLIDDICNNIINKPLKYELNAEFKAVIGEPLSFKLDRTVFGNNYSCTFTGDIVEEAVGKVTDIEDIRKKLSQLGNTEYTYKELNIFADKNAFVPASAIKNLRRNAIIALEENICEHFRRKCISGSFVDNAILIKDFDNNTKNNMELNVGVSTLEQLKLIANEDCINGIIMSKNIYKSGLKDGVIDTIKHKHVDIYISLPLIVKNRFDMAEYLPNNHISGIYIGNIDSLFAYVEYAKYNSEYCSGLKIICGDGVYGYNNFSRDFISSLIPNVEFEMPRELNKRELLTLSSGVNHIVAYEYQQVMLSAQCVIKNKQGCNRTNSIHKLKDDKNNVFYASARCDECCNIIYNGIPYMIFEQLDMAFLKDANIKSIRVNFTIEDDNSIREILDYVKKYLSESGLNETKKIDKRFTNGHFNRGVE